ncbi:PKD domain-containing protein [Cesiribacter andamanensis]|uniref:Fibronectin type III domain protein n=1 Tax=Cesiribacter andamanensis AMV16 TaxID=1279009 RepID=M7P247_9BACT|nr:fibronectin type III domain-containing protein [Cesiribacter andamanensis]EMR04649.1 Fibronectin type III domain protein [Cesiribacter andamanensis AMV16]
MLVHPSSANNTLFFSFFSRTFLTAFFLLLGLSLTNSLQAQDCGCDHTITSSQSYIEAKDMPGGVKPGDVICIKAGVRGRLKLIGFQGTKDQPLTFKNCGGQVIFDNTSMDGTFVFDQSKYIRITGTGSSSHKYGFYIRTASKGSAMYVTETDIEVDHIEIADAGFAGIMSKVEAKCDNREYHRGNFTMYNMSFHDLYIHGTRGEGLYIGSSYYTGKDYGCGMVYSHEIHGLRVYNNIVENTGADGIQIGCATKDVEMYNNTIKNYGLDPFASSQDMGLILNPGTSGKFYNNQIFDGKGMGIMVLGIGNISLYNNLVVRPGGDGIFIDERGPLLPNSGYQVLNNTIVNPGRDGIRMYSRNSVGNRFINNIVAEPKTLHLNYYTRNQYLYLNHSDIQYTASNNLFVPKITDVKFVNAGSGNYQLQETSNAVNKGANLGSQVGFDLLRTPRPQGGTFDIGAYEFSGTQRTSNALPVVNAGSDRTLTLPTNSITLSGSASDTDGSIASKSWTKVSGPSATMSGTSSLSLGLSNLVEGTYTFRLSATDNAGATSYDDVLVTVKAESSSTTTTTNSSGLNAPSNLAGVADKTSAIKLSWKNTNGSNAGEHEIHMSVGNSSSYYLRAKAGSTATAYTVTSLTKGQTYYFKVRAKGSKGYSEFSNEIVFKMVEGAVATTTDAGSSSSADPTVSAGSNQTLTLPSNSVSLRGSAKAEDGSTPSVSWTKVNGPSASMTGSNTLTLSASNLSEGTYTFRLTATDSKGNTAFDDVQVTVQAESSSTSGLNAPSHLAGVADKTSAIKLSWRNNNGTNASEHEIFMSVGNSNSYYQRAKAGSTATAYTVTNLTEGQTYYFKVRAKGSKGYSNYSNEIVFKMVAGAVASSTDGSSSDDSASSSSSSSDTEASTSTNSSGLYAPANLAGVADKTSAIKLNWKTPMAPVPASMRST